MRFQINQLGLNLFQPISMETALKTRATYRIEKKNIGNTHLCPGTKAFVGAWA